MNIPEYPNEVTPIGRQLINKFKLQGLELHREDYSCTIELGTEMPETFKLQLEKGGYEVIHEEGNIYTIQYSNEI